MHDIKRFIGKDHYLNACSDIDYFIKQEQQYFKEISEVIAIETLAYTKTQFKLSMRFSLEKLLTFLIMSAHIINSVSYVPTMVYNKLTIKDVLEGLFKLNIDTHFSCNLSANLKEQFFIIKNECICIKDNQEYDLLLIFLNFIFNEDGSPYERGIQHGIIRLKKIIEDKDINYILMSDI